MAKRTVFFLLAVLMLTAVYPFSALAAEGEKWIFIDGENITRGTDMAVIYRDMETDGQTKWGHDIVIDSTGEVTRIIPAGDSSGENLAIPVSGAVISASGAEVDWFKSNVKVGSRLAYDAFTHRLFVCGENGNYDPYYTETATVKTSAEGYILALADGTPAHTYDVAVDADGYIVAVGNGAVAPEGGWLIQAATAQEREFLMMYAPVGASASVDGTVLTLSYKAENIKKTVDTAFSHIKAEKEKAESGYAYYDSSRADALIFEGSKADTAASYETASSYARRVYESFAVEENASGELRSAMHIPDETSREEVEATVRKAKEAGLNSIILKATNGYGTFIVMPEGDKFKQDSKFGGFDVLNAYIEVCREEGLSLTLSVDVYYNAQATLAESAWLSEANGTEKGISAKFFSPADTEFKKYFLGYIDYIISKYEISSLMLDYLRYPKFSESCDIGYDYETLQRFSDEYNVPITEAEEIKTALFDSKHWSSWVKFREGLVTDMAESVSKRVREKRPDITLIAAVQRDTVDYYYHQDSLGWIESGLFDGYSIVFAEHDTSEGEAPDKTAMLDGIIAEKAKIIGAYTGKKAFLFAELPTDIGLSSYEFSARIAETRLSGFDGFIADSLDMYLAQNHGKTVREALLSSASASPLGDISVSGRLLIEAASSRIDALLAKGALDEKSAADAKAELESALSRVTHGEFTAKEADELETDISIIFAQSGAKQSVTKELKALSKLVNIREVTAELPPLEDSSAPAEDSTGEESDQGESTAEDSGPVYSEPSGGGLDIDIGKLLIYIFVGVAIVGAAAAITVGYRRQKAAPKRKHMPKARYRDGDSDPFDRK